MRSVFVSLMTVGLSLTSINAFCDSVYTAGDDELCVLSTSTFEEECITFNSSYNIAAINGLAMHPGSGDLYIIGAIGTNNGNRRLFYLNMTDNDDYELVTIGTYTEDNDKLASITYTCDVNAFYGITGAQADHSMYSIDVNNNGSLTKVGDLDLSSLGNSLTYSPYSDRVYRVSGKVNLDIEEIEILANASHVNDSISIVNITSDVQLDGVRSIASFTNQWLFLIDTNEQLYLFNRLNGNNYTRIVNLTDSRKHKGIVCTDFVDICESIDTSTMMTTMMTTMADDNMTTMADDDDDDSDDGARQVAPVFAVLVPLLYVFVMDRVME